MPATQPIENHGVIGNMRTAALVATDGTIDWYCPTEFDSPSVFAAILDAERGGHFRIAPATDGAKSKQFYWPDSNVLVTRFLCAEGVVYREATGQEDEELDSYGNSSSNAESMALRRAAVFLWRTLRLAALSSFL